MIGLQELIGLFLLMLLVGIPLFLIAFVDILKSEFTGSNKIVWLLAVILVPLVGPIAYFFIGRKQKVKDERKG
jgi:hypothetical protein